MQTEFKVQKISHDYEGEVIEGKKITFTWQIANLDHISVMAHKHISAFSPSIMQDHSHESLVDKC